MPLFMARQMAANDPTPALKAPPSGGASATATVARTLPTAEATAASAAVAPAAAKPQVPPLRQTPEPEVPPLRQTPEKPPLQVL